MNDKLGTVFAILVISAGVLISLFNSWELSGESWGYWMYGRIFAENGTFSVKSPLYSLYLSLFLWLGHPHAFTAEYLVTTAIVASGLVALFRPLMGLWLSVFAFIVWLPFLQTAEPLNQKLAIGLICWALVLRRAGKSRMLTSCSYALMVLTYSLRAPFLIFLVLFAVADFLILIKKKGWNHALRNLLPRTGDWPLGVSLLLVVWFAVAQSALPWNNIWFSTTKYFPNSGKNQFEGTTVQSYNWDYIEIKYGTFIDKDFYFTNQEVFKGARNIFEQFTANPKWFLKITYHKIRKTIGSLAYLTDMRFILVRIALPLKLSGNVWAILHVILLLLIIYGAFRMAHELPGKESFNMNLFLVGSLIIVTSGIVGAPSVRYFTPFITVLIASSCWYGKYSLDALLKVISWINTHNILKRQIRPSMGGASTIFVALLLILLSNGITQWFQLGKVLASQLREGEFRILERHSAFSMKSSLNSIEPLIQNCQGVLSLEHTYLGAFANIPMNKLYDVWEIPPFGHLGGPAFDGLKPERIDCILESQLLPDMVGCATNVQIRYQNYIKPYIAYLQQLGAEVHEIPRYGRAIILDKRRTTQK